MMAYLLPILPNFGTNVTSCFLRCAVYEDLGGRCERECESVYFSLGHGRTSKHKYLKRN